MIEIFASKAGRGKKNTQKSVEIEPGMNGLVDLFRVAHCNLAKAVRRGSSYDVASVR
jgi:hypothetical protein